MKEKVKSKALRESIVKDLECVIFGNDCNNGKSKDDKERTFAPPSPPKEDYSAETDEYLKYMEEQGKDRKKFSDEYDSN